MGKTEKSLDFSMDFFPHKDRKFYIAFQQERKCKNLRQIVPRKFSTFHNAVGIKIRGRN